VIILCIFSINYILLEISGYHSNIISDSYVFHYGNELVSRTGNKEIRHFVTTNFVQKYPFAQSEAKPKLCGQDLGLYSHEGSYTLDFDSHSSKEY